MVRQVNPEQPGLLPYPVATSILLIAVLGCSPKTSPQGTTPPADAEDVRGETPSHAVGGVLKYGPHDGHLFRLGNGEYYAEMAHDSETQTVVVYLLDKAAQLPVASEDAEIVLHLLADRGPLTVRLTSAPQDSDPLGQSSRYYTMDAELSEALDVSQIVGRISLTLRGTTYGNAVVHERHADRRGAANE